VEPTTNPSIVFDGLDLLHAGSYGGTGLSLSFKYVCSFLPFLLYSYRRLGQKSRISFFLEEIFVLGISSLILLTLCSSFPPSKSLFLPGFREGFGRWRLLEFYDKTAAAISVALY
jgi:hypothetical protein